jgi:hypothetical protein
VLITEADLPGSWVESRAIDLGADSEDSICNVPGPDTVIEPIARAEVQLQQTDVGPFVAETISAYRTEAEASAIMEYLREAISCSVWEDEARDRTWQVSPLAFPDKGDDTFSVLLSSSLGFIGSIRLQAVFVQTDDMVTLVANGALGQVDVNETEAIVDIALERLEQLP